MGCGATKQKKGKIPEIDKSACRRMGVQIAASYALHVLAAYLGRRSQKHDTRPLKGVAGRTLVQHERDPAISEDVLGMNRKAGNQQDWRAICVACDINQGAIRVPGG